MKRQRDEEAKRRIDKETKRGNELIFLLSSLSGWIDEDTWV